MKPWVGVAITTTLLALGLGVGQALADNVPSPLASGQVTPSPAIDQQQLAGYKQCQFISYPLPIGRNNLQAGQLVYSQNCAGCHGQDGKKVASSDLSDLSTWKYGSLPREVFRSLAFGVPGGGKPGSQTGPHGVLKNCNFTEEQLWNVTASTIAMASPPQTASLPSGLQYAILHPGTGAKAMPGQRVVAHYRGWLTNGVQFDSSYPRKSPFAFVLGAGQVIKGWDEGVQGMQVGELRQLLVPANLGYGNRGAGTIPPGATLIFQVELVAIQ